MKHCSLHVWRQTHHFQKQLMPLRTLRWDLLIQLFTMTRKCYEIARNVLTFRDPLIEGNGKPLFSSLRTSICSLTWVTQHHSSYRERLGPNPSVSSFFLVVLRILAHDPKFRIMPCVNLLWNIHPAAVSTHFSLSETNLLAKRTNLNLKCFNSVRDIPLLITSFLHDRSRQPPP